MDSLAEYPGVGGWGVACVSGAPGMGPLGWGWGEPGLGAQTPPALPEARPALGVRAVSPPPAWACQRTPVYKEGSREAGKLSTLCGITLQISARIRRHSEKKGGSHVTRGVGARLGMG